MTIRDDVQYDNFENDGYDSKSEDILCIVTSKLIEMTARPQWRQSRPALGLIYIIVDTELNVNTI